jgi:hypothetical protein
MSDKKVNKRFNRFLNMRKAIAEEAINDTEE